MESKNINLSKILFELKAIKKNQIELRNDFERLIKDPEVKKDYLEKLESIKNERHFKFDKIDDIDNLVENV